MDREILAAERFNCTIRERALFESGIKMGTIYHQFVGVPVSIDNVDVLERSIEGGVKIQPYVEDVKVKICRDMLTLKKDRYSYCSLTGDMLDVVLKIKIEDVVVTSKMHFDEELKYPLMYISDIQTN